MCTMFDLVTEVRSWAPLFDLVTEVRSCAPLFDLVTGQIMGAIV